MNHREVRELAKELPTMDLTFVDNNEANKDATLARTFSHLPEHMMINSNSMARDKEI